MPGLDRIVLTLSPGQLLYILRKLRESGVEAVLSGDEEEAAFVTNLGMLIQAQVDAQGTRP